MDALQLTPLERPLLWPVLTRPSLAAFEVSTEDLFDIQFEGDGEPGDDPKARIIGNISGLRALSACVQQNWEWIGESMRRTRCDRGEEWHGSR